MSEGLDCEGVEEESKCKNKNNNKEKEEGRGEFLVRKKGYAKVDGRKTGSRVIFLEDEGLREGNECVSCGSGFCSLGE